MAGLRKPGKTRVGSPHRVDSLQLLCAPRSSPATCCRTRRAFAARGWELELSSNVTVTGRTERLWANCPLLMVASLGGESDVFWQGVGDEEADAGATGVQTQGGAFPHTTSDFGPDQRGANEARYSPSRSSSSAEGVMRAGRAPPGPNRARTSRKRDTPSHQIARRHCRESKLYNHACRFSEPSSRSQLFNLAAV